MNKNNCSIADLLAGKIAIDSSIAVKGWIRTRRDSKAGFSFIMLHDGSCFQPLQIVAANSLTNYDSEILHLTAGCSIVAIGKLIASPAKGQSFELQAEKIEVIGKIIDPENYPITPKHHTLEYLREYGHLRARTNTIGAVTRVQNCVAQAIHRFFYEHEFYWIHTPIITSNDCEGAGELFKVTTLDLMNIPKNPTGKVNFDEDFFGREAFLTVSGQLAAESYCLAMSKVYTFGPTFRAENSNTSRHLAEFWMIEPELAFADLNDNARLAEELLKYICAAVLTERSDDMEFFAKRVDRDCITRLENIANQEFAQLDYSEAIAQLEKSKVRFEFPVKWGVDLQSEHERYLTEKLFNKPVIVTNYPKDIKGFYMRLNDDGKTVAAMDVLAPGIGEIIGGSQREDRFEVLEQRMNELKMNQKLYDWYLDLRRFGTVPHAGFGLGFERFVGYLTGMGNIRDIIPFPRTPKHAKF